MASRLLEYEMWNRVNGRGLAASHGDALRLLLSRVAFLELSEPVLTRARHPFPRPVRTLDALHLASVAFLRENGLDPVLATYDARMREAAEGMGIPLYGA